MLTDEQKAAIKTQVPLGRYGAAGRDRADGAVADRRRRGVRHRGSHPGRRWTRNGALTCGILDGKRILVAGVTMDSSIGFAAAKVAQEQGATVLISNFGRALGITRRIAKRLPTEPPVLELDVTDDDHLAGLADAVREHVDGLDGVVHSIAYGNPETLLGGKFLDGPWPDVAQAVQVSAYSLKSLADGLPAADVRGRLGRRADLRRHRRLAGVRLDGRGQGRRWSPPRATSPATSAPTASAATWSRPARSRRWPPRRSRASRTSSRCGRPRAARLGQRPTTTPTAQAVCALLSDFFPATTGEIVHVDGGFHAMGA